MSKFAVKVEHTRSITEFQMSAPELLTELQPLVLSNTYVWDFNYWYVSLLDWNKIMQDVLIGMPKYTIDKFDCENFAMLVSTRVSERYQLNTCGIAIGKSPWGEHGYNLLVHDTGLIYFEPQTGEFIPVSGGGYTAHTVIFG